MLTAATGAAFAASEIYNAIKALYGVASDFNDFINNHIDKMKASDNKTIARTGRVLDGVKQGFLIGYASSVIVIAAGQVILGNTLTAASVTATAATLTNPVAMTCGAVGAIFYGWSALSDDEKERILDTLSKGLQVGVELVKSLIRYVIEKTKELLSAENLEEIKNFVSTAASVFGKPLGSITRKLADVASDNIGLVVSKTGNAVEATKLAAGGAYSTAVSSVEVATEKMIDTIGKTKGLAGDAYSSVAETAERISEKITAKVKKSRRTAH